MNWILLVESPLQIMSKETFTLQLVFLITNLGCQIYWCDAHARIHKLGSQNLLGDSQNKSLCKPKVGCIWKQLQDNKHATLWAVVQNHSLEKNNNNKTSKSVNSSFISRQDFLWVLPHPVKHMVNDLLCQRSNSMSVKCKTPQDQLKQKKNTKQHKMHQNDLFFQRKASHKIWIFLIPFSLFHEIYLISALLFQMALIYIHAYIYLKICVSLLLFPHELNICSSLPLSEVYFPCPWELKIMITPSDVCQECYEYAGLGPEDKGWHLDALSSLAFWNLCDFTVLHL